MHGLEAGPRRFPRSLADHLMKEEPGYAPAASTATPQHFTVASRQAQKDPPEVPRPEEEAETNRTRPRSVRFEPVSTKEA